MSPSIDLQNVNMDFLKKSLYKDLRGISKNAFDDIKVSLNLGTITDVVYYLKKYSKLLNTFTGNEKVKQIGRGSFSTVYESKSNKKRQVIIKKSHEGIFPLQLSEQIYIPVPRLIIQFLFDDYEIDDVSLKRDVYDYEKVIKPYFGEKRVSFTGKKMLPYLNWLLFLVDNGLPDLPSRDIKSKAYWHKLLKKKQHKDLNKFIKYLKSFKTQKSLIPNEERYIFYYPKNKSLQTIFIQESKKGEEELLPDKYSVYPHELVNEGVIPEKLPVLMVEHFLTAIYSFVSQLEKNVELAKAPDYRPADAWKSFPPSPYEYYVSETNNLVVSKKNGEIEVAFIDTHILMESKTNQIHEWLEKRYWLSLFTSLRFWMRKIEDKW